MADRPGSRSVRSAVLDELDARRAGAFVHVGSPDDPVRRGLTGFSGIDSDVGLVLRSERGAQELVCLLPERAGTLCQQGFVGDSVTTEQPLGRGLRTYLDSLSVDGPVLAAPTIPHDTALYVEQAGYDLQSTDVVAIARRTKTADERAQIDRTQEAARAGIQRARTCLSALSEDSRPEDAATVPEGELTVDQLRQAIDETIVASGALPAGGTQICHGTTESDPQAVFRRSDPVVVRCAPRGPAGYHGWLTRTIVPDSEGGWERRAHVAVTNARQAALAVLARGAGVPIEEVRTESLAELGAYGFGRGDPDSQVAVSCHGIGLSPYERPTDPREDLQPGDVLALSLSVTGPDTTVALGDTVVLQQADSRVLADESTALAP
jgi:Xaa-Pro aminopeptidase